MRVLSHRICSSIVIHFIFSFWFLLEPPKRSDGNSNGSNKGNGTTGDLSKVSSSRSSEIDSEVAPIIGKSTSLSYKFSLIPSLFKYMIPLFLVYLFEYFINQGLVSTEFVLI